MRLKMDTTSVRFMVTKGHEPKRDRDTQQQRIDKATGALLWQLQLMALDESGAEVLTVVVDGEPKVSVGEYVHVEGLFAVPWTQGDRSGVSFRAVRLTSLSAANKPQASAA
jgi:hypothetical protein